MPASVLQTPPAVVSTSAPERRYPVTGVMCELCGLIPAVDRHHVDRDIANEAPENVLRLCEPCHYRQHAGTICSRGHLFEGHNVYTDPKGHRHCRVCQNLRRLRLYYRRRYGQVPQHLTDAVAPRGQRGVQRHEWKFWTNVPASIWRHYRRSRSMVRSTSRSERAGSRRCTRHAWGSSRG